jgi:hypothetical protein
VSLSMISTRSRIAGDAMAIVLAAAIGSLAIKAVSITIPAGELT